MEIILVAILLLVDILTYIIFFDIILSWLTLLWLNIRPLFVSQILDPIYETIKKYIPVSFWPFLFTPLILLLILYFIKWLVFLAHPGISSYYTNITNLF